MKMLIKSPNKLFIRFLICAFIFFSAQMSFASKLPELPQLPEFDTVTAPDGLDVFAPSEIPPEIAPTKPQPVVQTQTAKPQTSVQKTQPVTSKTTTTKSTQTKQGTTVTRVTNQSKTTSTAKNTNNSYYTNNQKAFVVPKGKKFKVNLNSTISSKTPEGTRISFRSIYPETSRYITIPADTVFYGRITDSHPPQITGNGGLIVIRVTQMVYKGHAYPIDATVSMADGKNIFFNNIKGERMYLKSIAKSMKPGTTYFKKMWKVTKKLARNESGVEIILTPFSFVAGSVVYVANLVASPCLAIFYKGKSITIPAGAPFTIKLREDAILAR